MVVSCAAWDSPRLDMVTAGTCIKASAVGRYLSLVPFARNIPKGNFNRFLTIVNFSVHPIFFAASAHSVWTLRKGSSGDEGAGAGAAGKNG
jgi:hypothetical protein